VDARPDPTPTPEARPGDAERAAEERLAAHVDRVLARSSVSRRDRADVAEELLGHLQERFAAAREAGATPDDAAEEAIAAFGASGEVGSAFVSTFHSRLWASTIGALLPVDVAQEAAPSAITWTVRFFRVLAGFSLLSAPVLALTSTPVHAVVGTAAAVAFGAALLLVAEGLRRRQAWTVGLAALVLVLEALTFAARLIQPDGGFHVDLLGLAGAILLASWVVQDRAIAAWMTETGRVRSLLTGAIGLAIVASTIVGFGLQSIPDPTQIGPSDIEAVASVTCAPAELASGGTSIPIPTVTLDVRYRRADLLPAGLAGSESELGDPIGVSDNLGAIALPGTTTVFNTTTGVAESRSWTTASVNPDVPVDTVATTIELEGQRSGDPIRITIPMQSDVGDDRVDRSAPIAGRQIDVRLGHLDRFVLGAQLDCGERRALVPGVDGQS
jgi:hypothetical protein